MLYKSAAKALGYLRNNVVHDKDGHIEQQAKLKMDSRLDKMKEENTKQIGKLCHYELERIYRETMENNIQRKVYEVSDGYKVFKQDINRLKDVYLSTLKDFEEHEILLPWCGFLDDIKKQETLIIDADECMSKKEKEDERRRNEENVKKIIEEHNKKQALALDEQRKTMDEHYSNLNRERKQQHEQEMQKLENLFDLKLKNEQEERKDLMHKIEKANEEKINRLLREEQSRHDEHMARMMEQQQRSHAETLQLQREETTRLRKQQESEKAERESLMQQIRAIEETMSQMVVNQIMDKDYNTTFMIQQNETMIMRNKQEQLEEKLRNLHMREQERKAKWFGARLWHAACKD